MAAIKDKTVTVESLSVLHEYNTKSYMPITDPTGSGTMTMNGSATFSGSVNVGSLMIGTNIMLVPTNNSIEIVFLEEETTEEG